MESDAAPFSSPPHRRRPRGRLSRVSGRAIKQLWARGRNTAWAMSEESVELVRKAAAAWNSGGPEGLLPFYPEDVVWYPFPNAPGSAGGLHGHDGIREVMAGWTDSFEDFSLVTNELRDLGDKVVWLGADLRHDQGVKRAGSSTGG